MAVLLAIVAMTILSLARLARRVGTSATPEVGASSTVVQLYGMRSVDTTGTEAAGMAEACAECAKPRESKETTWEVFMVTSQTNWPRKENDPLRVLILLSSGECHGLFVQVDTSIGDWAD